MPGQSSAANLIFFTLRGVVLLPILGIVVGFGEEYGWRGYLQSELFKLGRVRGVLLLGVIWGVWHWPVILMGHNYPDHQLLGLVLMVFYTTGLAVVLGNVVLKSGSVILAAYLRVLNNQVVAFIAMLGFKAYDSAFSFGLGIYGIAMLAIIALLILRDPVWRGRGGNLPEPTPADRATRYEGQVIKSAPELLRNLFALSGPRKKMVGILRRRSAKGEEHLPLRYPQGYGFGCNFSKKSGMTLLEYKLRRPGFIP